MKICNVCLASYNLRERRANETIIEQNNRLNNNVQRQRDIRANESVIDACGPT